MCFLNRQENLEIHKLGLTDLRISQFGMGCGNFGGIGSAPAFFGQGETETEAFELLDLAVDLGINYLDTADAYGGGRSETTIGKWLRARGSSVRDRLLLSSKVANQVGEDPTHRGLSKTHILRQVDSSLARLGVDHLDMYLAHEPDPETPIEETVEAFDSLVTAGKIRYFGASNYEAPLLETALTASDSAGWKRFDWVQNSFNLIDQADQSDTLEVCAKHSLGFTNFSPLCGGWLTGKYRFDEGYPEGSRMTKRPEPYMQYWTEETFASIDHLTSDAADLGVSAAGLALAWLRKHPQVDSSIVGPRRPSHFQPVEEAISLDLSPDQWAEVGGHFLREVS